MSDAAPLMVGVSGLRGIVGKSLTPEVAARFAGAFGGWLAERGDGRTVVVGRDGRAGGEPIHDAACEALAKCGLTVVDIGIAMTPTVGVMADHLDAAGGMVVTASHNPQEWNGLKCLVRSDEPDRGDVDAAAPAALVAKEIIARFESGGVSAGATIGKIDHEGRGAAQGRHEGLVFMGLRERGIAVPLRPGFRVVLDSVNGAGAAPGAGLMAALGCRLEHLGNEGTGVFPHTPEPTRENLRGLCDAVKARGGDIGFAQDPDADRLAIVDERGEYIGEEYTLALAAESLLSLLPEGPPEPGRGDLVLVTNLSTSRMIDDVAARHGARVVRTAVGEANVVEAMKREAAAGNTVVLGGEGNGGVIWPRVTYVRDSLSAMALVLSLMAGRKQKLSEIVASMPSYSIEKRKVDLARKEDARPAVDKIAAAYKAHRIDLQDGVRVDFAQGPLSGKAWLHVRASNTEPIMRLIAEAPTAEAARGVLDEAARVIGG